MSARSRPPERFEAEVSTPAATPPSAGLESGAEAVVPCTLREFCAYFLRLGTLGFGGPIALAGYMQRDLVEDRRWITKDDYKRGLAAAPPAPGPPSSRP